MEVTKVSQDDGRECANLIKFLTKGRWDLSGEEAEALTRTKQWLNSVALRMAEDLRSSKQPAPAPESAPIRVKQMGSLPTATKKQKKK